MISIQLKKSYFVKERIFFTTDQEFYNIKTSADVVESYYGKVKPKSSLFSSTQSLYSAENDLTLTAEQLRASFTKTVKNELNRAEKESHSFLCYSSNDIIRDVNLMPFLRKQYELFCVDNNREQIAGYFQENELNAIAQNGGLLITRVTYEFGDIYHIYVHDEINSMLWFSFSVKNQIGEDRNLQGRMNKLLHFNDFVLLQSKGIHCFNWGGLFDPNNPNGIDKFKLSFGSTPCDAYTIMRGNTLKGKLLVFLLNIKKMLKR